MGKRSFILKGILLCLMTVTGQDYGEGQMAVDNYWNFGSPTAGQEYSRVIVHDEAPTVGWGWDDRQVLNYETTEPYSPPILSDYVVVQREERPLSYPPVVELPSQETHGWGWDQVSNGEHQNFEYDRQKYYQNRIRDSYSPGRPRDRDAEPVEWEERQVSKNRHRDSYPPSQNERSKTRSKERQRQVSKNRTKHSSSSRGNGRSKVKSEERHISKIGNKYSLSESDMSNDSNGWHSNSYLRPPKRLKSRQNETQEIYDYRHYDQINYGPPKVENTTISSQMNDSLSTFGNLLMAMQMNQSSPETLPEVQMGNIPMEMKGMAVMPTGMPIVSTGQAMEDFNSICFYSLYFFRNKDFGFFCARNKP